MTVTFGTVTDYLAELESDADKIERGIVRRSYVYEQSSTPPIRRVSLVSTTRIAGEIVSLSFFCGELWGDGFEHANEKVEERSKDAEQRIEAFCAMHELELRGGRLE